MAASRRGLLLVAGGCWPLAARRRRGGGGRTSSLASAPAMMQLTATSCHVTRQIPFLRNMHDRMMVKVCATVKEFSTMSGDSPQTCHSWPADCMACRACSALAGSRGRSGRGCPEVARTSSSSKRWWARATNATTAYSSTTQPGSLSVLYRLD